MRSLITGVLALITLGGCATYMDVERNQKPIITVQAERPGVGLLDVSVDDDVLARAPNDFGNMTGLIAKVMRDYVDQRGGFNAVDYTHLGFKAKWERSFDARDNAAPVKVAPLEGVPAGVQTPLVTVVKVVEWRTGTEAVGKDTKDVAVIKLAMSTWTREGREVHSEFVDAMARTGESFLFLKAGDKNLVTWFQKADGKKSLTSNPRKRDELFMNVLREAVGVHYFPYFQHTVSERFVLADEEPLKAGVALALRGAYDEALESWKAVYEKDEKAHGAMYNAALMHLVRGDDDAAFELLRKAYAVSDKFLYGGMLSGVEARLKLRKSVDAGGAVSGNGPGA